MRSFLSSSARAVMADSSLPHIVMRMRGSVPEGRTSKRPSRAVSWVW